MKTDTPKIKRLGHGYYILAQGKREVEVIRQDEFVGDEKWMARATWSQYLYSDPVRTKREAVACARDFFADNS